jgi:hypothetical protein
MSRRALTILVVVLALLPGLYLYLRVQEARAWTAAIDETKEVFELAMAAYFAGRNEEAARALGAYLTFLESSTPSADPWKPPAHPFLDPQGLAMERTVTAVRLAIVEERLGYREAAANTWARAAQHAAEAKVQNTDPESLREIARRLDETAFGPDLP